MTCAVAPYSYHFYPERRALLNTRLQILSQLRRNVLQSAPTTTEKKSKDHGQMIASELHLSPMLTDSRCQGKAHKPLFGSQFPIVKSSTKSSSAQDEASWKRLYTGCASSLQFFFLKSSPHLRPLRSPTCLGLVCGLISRCIRDPPRIIRRSPHLQSLTDVTAAAGLPHSPYHSLAALNFLTTGRPASRPDDPSWPSIIVTCDDLAAPCYMHADGD